MNDVRKTAPRHRSYEATAKLGRVDPPFVDALPWPPQSRRLEAVRL